MRIVQKDGDDFPELAALYHDRIVRRGEEQTASVFTRLAEEGGVSDRDPRAIAAVALGSLVQYRLQESMFGVPPFGLGEEDFIDAWVDVWATYGDRLLVPQTTVGKRGGSSG
jgi:hypothetical protein